MNTCTTQSVSESKRVLRVSGTQWRREALAIAHGEWRRTSSGPAWARGDLFNQIAALRRRPECEESGFAPPSREASLRAIALLTAIPDPPTTTSISDDGQGGLEIYWMGVERHVQLNVPSRTENAPTLFWDSGGNYSLEPLTSLGQLSDRLGWFTEE